MRNYLEVYKNRNSLQTDSEIEDKILDIALDLLKYCNHTLRAATEEIRASLAKSDAMDKYAEMCRKYRKK